MGCCSAKARVTAYAPSTAIDQRVGSGGLLASRIGSCSRLLLCRRQLVAALKKREAQQQAEEQKEGRRRSFTVDTLAMRLQHVSVCAYACSLSWCAVGILIESVGCWHCSCQKVLVHIRRAFHEFDAVRPRVAPGRHLRLHECA